MTEGQIITTITGDRYRVCQDCKDTDGWFEPPVETEFGWYPGGPCPKCNGTGKLPVEETEKP